MTILTELQTEGWHLSNEGFDLCSENMDKPTVSSVIRKALDMDLREIGGNFLPEDLSKGGKIETISGPGVLQIQKVKNASAPKYEYGSGAPPVFRLLLTDGNSYINCLQWGQWKSISLETPPGTKIYLKPGKITMQSSFLLLNEHQFIVLGGCVAAMVEKWELCRKLASHIRTKENLDGTGPPPWIPFGQQIVKPSKSGSNFRSLESDVKDAKEDAVFKQQRQANIAEVARVKEAKSKSFGGRKEFQKPAVTKPDHGNAFYPQSNTYISNDNDFKRTPDFTQDSPVGNRPCPTDRNRKNTRNDYMQGRQDSTRPQTSNNVFGSQSPKDNNKLENKNKLGDFITQDFRQRAVYQTKSSDSEPSFMNSPKQYKAFNKDYRPSADKRMQKSDSKGLVNMMDQVKIYGYDAKDDRSNCAPGDTFLKPGMEVMAKYWEDHKFYRAVVHAVGKEGKTCVVHFLEYGNFEEVVITDVQEKSSLKDKNWNAGPISFLPSPRNSYDNYSTPHNQNYKDAAKVHQTANRGYGKPDNTKLPRNEYKPSAKLYQPPSRKDFNS